MGKAVALGAQHDGKLRRGGKGRVIDAHRAVTQGHGGGLEAQTVQPGKAAFRPVGRGGADLRPWHLKYGAHAHAHGAAAQRVTAGGCDEHGVHVQCGGTAEDGTHIGGVHDAFQHGYPAGIAAHLFHTAGRGAAECTQHAAGQLEAGQAGKHIPVGGVHRNAAAAGQDICRRAGDLFALHEQGKRLMPGVQRTGNHLGTFGNEDAFFRLQPIAQLRLRQAGVNVQFRCGKVCDLDDIRHGGSPLLTAGQRGSGPEKSNTFFLF